MDGIKIKGMADISVKSKKAVLNMRANNTIGRAAKRRILAAAVNEMMRGHCSMLGDREVYETTNQFVFARETASSGNTPYVRKAYCKEKTLSCALVNLTDEEYQSIAASTYEKGYLPILGSNCLVSADKVRAYANILNTADSDGVYGYGVADATDVNNINMAARKYVFPAGVGTGTVTGIAMIPSSWKPGNIGCGGATVFKRLNHNTAPNVISNSVISIPGLCSNPDDIYVEDTAGEGYYVNVITGEKASDNVIAPNLPNGTTVPYDEICINGIVYRNEFGYRNVYVNYNNNGTKGQLAYSLSSRSDAYYATDGTFYYNESNGRLYEFSTVNYNGSRYVAGLVITETTLQSNSLYTSNKALFDFYKNTLGIDLYALGWVDSTGAFVDNRVVAILPKTITADRNLTALVVFMKMDTTEQAANIEADSIVKVVYIFSSNELGLSNLVDIIPCCSRYDIVWGNSNGHYGLIRFGNSKDYTLAHAANQNSFGNCSLTTAGYTATDIPIYNSYNAIDIGAPKMLKFNSGGTFIEADDTVAVAHEGMWYGWISCLKIPSPVDKADGTEMEVTYKYEIQ